MSNTIHGAASWRPSKKELEQKAERLCLEDQLAVAEARELANEDTENGARELSASSTDLKIQDATVLRAGFYMIATVAKIAAIAAKKDQRSLRSYGNHPLAIVAITAILAMLNKSEYTASYTHSNMAANSVANCTRVKQHKSQLLESNCRKVWHGFRRCRQEV